MDPLFNTVDTNSLESVGKTKSITPKKNPDAWMGNQDNANWMNSKPSTKKISAGSAINSAAKYMGKKRANLKLSIRKK